MSFEYGTTTAYGANEASVATPNVPGGIMANLTGLMPGTLYHFRVKAVGDSTVYGSDVTFTTLPASTAKTNNYLTWIIVGGVILVAVVIVTIAVAGGRKKKLSR
jgi:phosphodiesterase/alkaline phosphatase D-like protein